MASTLVERVDRVLREELALPDCCDARTGPTLARIPARFGRTGRAFRYRQAPPRFRRQVAALGRQVAALLDIEQSVSGVNFSPVRPELRVIGVLTATSGQLDPNAGDLDLTAGWGHGGKGGVTMPGKGKAVARPFAPADAAALLGDTTYDVYLNGKAFWSNIPSAVWEYTLGGYQVIKKWLSYREKELLGRGLTKEEARHA